MSMKIHLKNLGILKHAEFSLGDLTIICGENNTGKTYATYALYGFLDSWRGLIDFEVRDTQIQRLLTGGGLNIELAQYVEQADRLLARACNRYTDQLARMVFAAPEYRFRDSEFRVEIEGIDIRDKEFEREMGIAPERSLIYSKKKGGEELTVTLVLEGDRGREIDPFFAKSAVNFIIGNTIFSDFFPNPFILFSGTYRGCYFSERA